jgi:hypothetical protein
MLYLQEAISNMYLSALIFFILTRSTAIKFHNSRNSVYVWETILSLYAVVISLFEGYKWIESDVFM